ncbi:putative LRR receptor-like serine/threonine-protein kinase [Acorus gramineus]|uniref:LRR receptor-like serine/threonine-protein kinase n=1 Tax=Acorus gramineus TaxID=55184 RepID=A0AAV9ATL7_ACOGR|nr:putative LRR receptor-like serine/threonine-protein kinase [Acorus gramineus]
MYGNYDGMNVNPEFDLYLGKNHWTIVNVLNASRTSTYEIIHVSRTSNVSVCLVNTGHGVPFISGLELRPLGGNIYTAATEDMSLVKYLRYNYDRRHSVKLTSPQRPVPGRPGPSKQGPGLQACLKRESKSCPRARAWVSNPRVSLQTQILNILFLLIFYI